MYAKIAANLSQLFLVHFRYINTGMLLYCIVHAHPLEWRFEFNSFVAHRHLSLSVKVAGYFLEQLLRERHHPVIVLVCNIELEHGKLRVTSAVHTFIAK